MLLYFNQILITSGIVFLGLAVYRGFRFVKFIKSKENKEHWVWLVVLSIFLIASFVVYLSYFRLRYWIAEMDLLVSSILFLSSLLTFCAARLGSVFVEEINEYARALGEEKAKLEIKVGERNRDLLKREEALRETNRKLKEADEMRKNFISHTAHEIRTPLNVFRWSVEMLRNEDLGQINLQQRELLDQVYQSNNRLLELVDNLLDVSRIDEARLEIKRASCQIEEIIDEAAGNLAIKIREKKFDFVWKRPADPMPKIRADKQKILQVFLNLLGNAVKFTPAGGKIEVRVTVVDEAAPKEILKRYGFVQKDKKYILTTVADTGMGIPKAEQEKMFTRFFRGSNVKRDQIEGTGLGMFIVLEIIKLHQGAIWFESDEGKGTTFYFTLPFA